MSSELAPKLRVVRCPKCRHLLPESPLYDVYKCGGCGTILQAKRLKSKVVKSESSSTHETDAALRNALNLVSEDKQRSNREQLVPPQENGLSEKATSSSSEECSLDGNGGRAQNENGEFNEQLGLVNLSDEELENEMDIYKLSLRRHRMSNKDCSTELTHCEIEAEASSLMAKNSVEVANDTNLQLAGAEELTNGNLLLEGAKEELIFAPNEEAGNNEKSALVGGKSEVEITGSHLEGKKGLNNGDLLLGGAKEEFISGSDGEDANHDKSALVVANPEVKFTESHIAGAEELSNRQLLLEAAEEELNMIASDGEAPSNDQSALVGAKSEVGIRSAPTAKMLSTEKFASGKGGILGVTPCKLEEGTSDNPVSTPNEQKKNIHRSFDHEGSMDTSDITEVINPSSDLSGTLGELSKSPTAGSSVAYDGSVSSYDGMDERVTTQHLDSFENSYTLANGVSEGRPRRGKGLVNGMLFGNLEAQQSYLPNRKHHVTKDSRENQNKVMETTRHGHQHWMRTKRDDEFPSRMPFHPSYEIGNPSNQMHDELYCSSSFLSPDSCEETDQEKMKLLRMIYKLQDQLNRTSYMSGETNERLSTGVSYKGKHLFAYHSHDLHHEGRFYHGLDHPRCNGRCSNGINWHQRQRFSRIPYSAEATSITHHVDHSRFHCCPQELHYSADLPPHVLFQHEELCRSHPGHNCCSSHPSYPSSPQWFIASEFPLYGRETKADDQRRRASDVKKSFREKQNLFKRHYRPVAGGAPFVTCHRCSELLQLPADFLLFQRVCHQLKCGACSQVLKFSLQNGSHIVSYSPSAIGPPSSELNDQSEVINSSNLPSASHANYYHYSHADPITYSDDYGNSVSKSYSSEGEPVSLTQFHPLRGSECDDNLRVSGGTVEPLTEKKISSRQSSTSKTSVKTEESAMLANDMSSEIEARSPPKSSSLHQLMGYSSPSQVIRGTRSSFEDKKPIVNGES